MNLRITATTLLLPIINQKRSLSNLSNEISDSKDRAYIHEICYGVSRWYFQLKFISKQLIQKPLKEKDQDVALLVLIGLYELIYMRAPDHAVVSETVEAARAMKKPWATKFINAVLRNFIRQKDSLIEKSNENLEAQYAHPNWLIKKIKAAWPENWQDILNTNNERAPMTLRVNQQKISRDHYLQQLSDVGIKAKPTTFSSVGIILDSPCSVSELPTFFEGSASVQDESAQLVAELLDLQTGQIVLDACAAPGGKTCHMLEMQSNLKKLIAVDQDRKRLVRVQENLDRLSLSAELIADDIINLKNHFAGETFDRMLLDAPCSATGVIRRHPDIKLLRRESDIKVLSENQLNLLKICWQALKPGGKLVYATCSVLPEENERVIEQFLTETNDAKEITIESRWGEKQKHGRQVLTGQNQMDGFYYAVFEKKI